MFEPNAIIVMLVLFGALSLFMWDRWRYDIVAMAVMFVLVILGQVESNQALAGFGHPAVITVLFALIISRGLRNSGIVGLLSQRLGRFIKTPTSHVLTMTATAAIISAFINNVGAIAIMLPVALASAQKMHRSPTFLLMPMAFGSLVGGMMTLIGTPPNIIVAEYRRQDLGESFGMFDFAFIGVPLVLITVLFLGLIGWRFMPIKRRHSGSVSTRISDYIMEIRAVEGCSMIGDRLIDLSNKYQDDVRVVGLVRGKDRHIHPADWRKIGLGDLLIVKTDPNLIQTISADLGFEIVSQKSAALKNIKLDEMRLMEAVVTNGSNLIGRQYSYFKKKCNNLISLIAISRESRDIRSRLHDITFQNGDVVLLQGESNTMDDAMRNLGLLPLAERDLTMIQSHKARLSVIIFAFWILVNIFTPLPIAFALLGVVLSYIWFDLIPARELYKEVDWSVIILLGAMFSLGEAMTNSQASQHIANGLVWFSNIGGSSLALILVILMGITMLLTNIINNAATALLMCPIAIEIAHQINEPADLTLMTVCIGASSAFLTPIGHQASTLVMGAAGYKFSDFWKLGSVLQLIIISVSIPLLILIWS